ncbi:hypothetical protein O3M35_006453 [Rhynocoris fuscipes]|uniref:Uncharacterized protein n=1 Tax=Rhynocoris fuscipes TaxID=488301 RepID=A0AAW1DG94_9HEMI
MKLYEVLRNLKRLSSLKLMNCDRPNNYYNNLVSNRRQHSGETDPEDVEAEEIGYKRSEATVEDTAWQSCPVLYDNMLQQPIETNEKSSPLVLSQTPPKLDWRTDSSYRRIMGVMGGLGWKECNKINDHCLLNFCPSDESNHIRHFKPLE